MNASGKCLIEREKNRDHYQLDHCTRRKGWRLLLHPSCYVCSLFFQMRIFNYIELIKSPHSIKLFYRLRCQQRTEASLLAWLNSLSLFIFYIILCREKKKSISVGLRLSSPSTTASFFLSNEWIPLYISLQDLSTV